MPDVSTRPEPETVTLWRPAAQQELDLVAASRWREWPPRLPGQPLFYPVLSRRYAAKITRESDLPGGRFVFFADPDGNKWSVQQVPRWG